MQSDCNKFFYASRDIKVKYFCLSGSFPPMFFVIMQLWRHCDFAALDTTKQKHKKLFWVSWKELNCSNFFDKGHCCSAGLYDFCSNNNNNLYAQNLSFLNESIRVGKTLHNEGLEWPWSQHLDDVKNLREVKEEIKKKNVTVQEKSVFLLIMTPLRPIPRACFMNKISHSFTDQLQIQNHYLNRH